MKKYTMDELRKFCDRADTEEKEHTARQFIKSRPYLNEEQKAELLELIENRKYELMDNENEENPFLPDYMRRGSRDYGPSNPWDAPGMSVKDFI